MRINGIKSKLAVAASLTFCLSACDSPEIDTALSTYNGDVQKISIAVQAFYANLNSLERTEYFNQLAYLPKAKMSAVIVLETPPPDPKTKEVTFIDPTTGEVFKPVASLPKSAQTEINSWGLPTGLYDKFSNDQILARIKCLQGLATYTANLAILAGDDSASKVESQLEQLKTPLNDIGAQLKSLQTRNKRIKTVGADIQKFSGPISDLVALTAGAWVAYEKERLLKKALKDANQKVSDTCDLLADDLDSLYLEYDGQVVASVNLAATTYNGLTKVDDDTAREKIRTSLKTSSDTLSLVNRSNPSCLVRQLKVIHEDIVDCLDESPSSNLELLEWPQHIFGLNRPIVANVGSESNEELKETKQETKEKKHESKTKIKQQSTESEPEPKKMTRAEKINKALVDLDELDSECAYTLAALNKLTGSKSDTSQTDTTDVKSAKTGEKKDAVAKPNKT